MTGGPRHGVPDAIFAHSRLAPVYDAFDGPREDLAAYLGMAAELGADRVLDVGCGTGCLAVPLAQHGYTVMAADPAAASLDVAKSKDKDRAVTCVHGDAAGVPAAGADLAMMTGNVAQVFLTGQDWAGHCGASAPRSSRGYLGFETRRPERRAWEEWAADSSPVILDVPGTGRVEQRHEITSVSPPFVSFRTTCTFLADGAVITFDSTLRFRRREELESSLTTHGYRVLDVRDVPDRPGCEFEFITERTI